MPGPGWDQYSGTMQRVLEGEIMDEGNVSEADMRAALRFIRGVNRRLGGAAALIRHLQTWSVSWPKGRPITLLDLGTGSADIPMAVRRWSQAHGHDVRITATDIHPLTLALAREHVGDTPGIEVRELDALSMRDTLGARSFDYVHAGMFLHHLSEIQILTVLAGMERVAARGVVWNDLVRSRLNLAFITLLTIGQPEIIKHDARASVRAGFDRREVMDLARRTDLGFCRYESSLFTGRFTLAGERPGAWPGGGA